MDVSGDAWTASSVGNVACAWRSQEALANSDGTGSFKPVSKWRILRRVFNCTRIWRYVGRQAQDLKVRYTMDVQFRSVEVNTQELEVPSKVPSCNTLPMSHMSESVGDQILRESTKQSLCAKARHDGCKITSGCKVHDLMIFFGQGNLKPCMVVAVAAVALTLEWDQHPRTDYEDWGGPLGTSNYLLGTVLMVQSKNMCVSIVTLFQAASILLFQAAYFWLKFREAASSARRKRKAPAVSVDLQDGDQAAQNPWPGVYARKIRDKERNVLGHRYEARFKPPRENGRSVQSPSLGSYADRRDAKIVHHIAAFYYGKATDVVSLGDGRSFRIPAMSARDGSLSGAKKAMWVSENAKKVFESFCNSINVTPSQSLSHTLDSQSTAASSATNPRVDQAWLPDPSASTQTRSVSTATAPSGTISHSGDHGAQNSALPLPNKGPNLVSSPNIISGLVIPEQIGFFTDLDTMVVDKVELAPWKLDLAAEAQLNTIHGIGEFLLADPDHQVDVVQGNRVEQIDYLSVEGMVGETALNCQLQPLIPFTQGAPTPCKIATMSQVSQFDPASGQHCPQFQSSEGAAAAFCNWDMEIAAVHNSHCSNQSSMMLSPALPRTDLCFENFTALLGMVSLQQKHIEEQDREIAFLKGRISGQKYCSFCG